MLDHQGARHVPSSPGSAKVTFRPSDHRANEKYVHRPDKRAHVGQFGLQGTVSDHLADAVEAVHADLVGMLFPAHVDQRRQRRATLVAVEFDDPVMQDVENGQELASRRPSPQPRLELE